MSEQRGAAERGPRTASGRAHGSSAAYNGGCRCDECVSWRRLYDRQRYRRFHQPDIDRLREVAAAAGYRLAEAGATAAVPLDVERLARAIYGMAGMGATPASARSLAEAIVYRDARFERRPGGGT